MRTKLVVFPASQTVRELAASFRVDHSPRGQYLYPVVDAGRRLIGVLTRKDVHRLTSEISDPDGTVGDLARREVEVARADEPLRIVVYRMADTGFTRMPVVDSSDCRKIIGIVSLEDLLRARTRALTEERNRERVLRIRLPFGSRQAEEVKAERVSS